MIYVDTNVIVSFIDEADPKHEEAVKVLGEYSDAKVVSWLSLIELSSVYSRAGIANPTSMAIYSVEETGAKLLDLDMEDVYKRAFKLSKDLRLRTLDLLHISACITAGCKYFMTFDKEIRSSAPKLNKLGVEII